MSLIIKQKNFKPLIAPLFLLASGFMFGQQAASDTVKVDTKDIEEVVVIGYGKVKKSDLTGSVSSVSAKDLAATPSMNALQALQGRAAGLNIVTAGGAPGAGANVTIRGGASITQGTEPLYIVDGFRYGFIAHANANIQFGALLVLCFAIVINVIGYMLIKKGVKIKH